MATFTWNGVPLSVTDPNGWTPTGVPGDGDTAIISTGTALMIADTANPTFQFGTPVVFNQPQPTPPNLDMVGHNSVTLNVFSTSDQSLVPNVPLDGTVNATGQNTITANIGAEPEDVGSQLTLNTVGSLDGTYNAFDSTLDVNATGSVTGTYNLAGFSSFDLEGGVAARLSNATVNYVLFHGLTPDSTGVSANAVINATVGPNVTFNLDAEGTSVAQSSLELGGRTSASDVINLTSFSPSGSVNVLKIDQPITFMRPFDPQINLQNPEAISAAFGGNIGFNTRPIDDASYANGVLSLDEAGHTVTLNIAGLDNTNFSIVQSAPQNGLVHAQLAFTPGGYNVTQDQHGLPIPTGGNVVSVA
jgi:hypothetical protein